MSRCALQRPRHRLARGNLAAGDAEPRGETSPISIKSRFVATLAQLFSWNIQLFVPSLEVELDKTRLWCPNRNCETICTVGNDKPSSSQSPVQQPSSSNATLLLPRSVLCPTCSLEFCSSCKKPVSKVLIWDWLESVLRTFGASNWSFRQFLTFFDSIWSFLRFLTSFGSFWSLNHFFASFLSLPCLSTSSGFVWNFFKFHPNLRLPFGFLRLRLKLFEDSFKSCYHSELLLVPTGPSVASELPWFPSKIL